MGCLTCPVLGDQVKGKLSSEGDRLKGASATRIPVDPNFNGSLCNGSNSQSLLFSNGQKKQVYTDVLNGLNGK